jgi:hypothetical protein
MKKDIIYKYLNICINYFYFMENSLFLTSLYNCNFLILIGFRAINHVFLFNSKYLNCAVENTEKAYIYYLEYLEQLNKTNMMNELNHMDAILFLYNKTIPNYTGNSSESTEIVNKIDTVDYEIYNQIMLIFHFINSLLFWENQNIKRYEIVKEYIFDYVKLFLLLSETDMLNLYFELAQKNILLYNNDNYTHFLNESHKQIRKKIHKDNNYCIEWKKRYIQKIPDMDIKYNTVKELIHNLLD